MELIYLWVEEYKCIHKQGFDFSGRYRCHYNHITNELKIEENKDYFHIFPKNINVTAIVGKNGSGKSTLIELIMGGIYSNEKNWRKIKTLFMLFKNGDQFEYIQLESPSDREMVCETQSLISLDISTYQKYAYQLLMDFSIMQRHIWNHDQYKQNYSLEPSRDYSGNAPGWNCKIEPTSFEPNMKANAVYFYKFANEELIKSMRVHNFKKIYISKKNRSIGAKSLVYEMEDINEYFKQNKKFCGLSKDDIFEVFKLPSGRKDDYGEYKVKAINKAIAIDSPELDSDSLEFLSTFDLFLQIEIFNDDEDIYFYNLSVGTQIFLSYFGLILKTYMKRIKDTKRNTFVIYIDEVENSLHPSWQKDLLNFLLLFLENKLFGDLKFQLVFITHSPFILSDIQRNNTIYLDRDENRNCKVVDGLRDKKQTFGANIHTLLSDAFFMEDGLMGEFAKDRINTAIFNLNKKQLSKEEIDYCENIIAIIGEPILKRQLQKMLDSKRISKLDEIDELKRRIEALESQK